MSLPNPRPVAGTRPAQSVPAPAGSGGPAFVGRMFFAPVSGTRCYNANAFADRTLTIRIPVLDIHDHSVVRRMQRRRPDNAGERTENQSPSCLHQTHRSELGLREFLWGRDRIICFENKNHLPDKNR